MDRSSEIDFESEEKARAAEQGETTGLRLSLLIFVVMSSVISNS